VTRNLTASLESRTPNTLRRSRKVGGFTVGSLLVSPARGVFRLCAIQDVRVGDEEIPSLILRSDDSRSSLTVPIAQVERGAVRPLASWAVLREALAILGERPRKQRSVWARRAQEYQAKIKTGDPHLLAEVLRDVHRSGEQSFSEREIFERALDRFVDEFAAVKEIERDAARKTIIGKLTGREQARGSPR
jgi:CarD family transcriptional regulator